MHAVWPVVTSWMKMFSLFLWYSAQKPQIPIKLQCFWHISKMAHNQHVYLLWIKKFLWLPDFFLFLSMIRMSLTLAQKHRHLYRHLLTTKIRFQPLQIQMLNHRHLQLEWVSPTFFLLILSSKWPMNPTEQFSWFYKPWTVVSFSCFSRFFQQFKVYFIKFNCNLDA